MISCRRSKIQIRLLGILLIVLTVSLLFITYQCFPDTFRINKTPQLNMNCGEANTNERYEFPKLEPFQGEKLVHIDLKGAPPLISFLQEFFPYIKKFGATGILIEYEDMFYYRDELKNLRARNAYPPSAFKKILQLAEENNLMIVPLVQTFGHFEFVLKLKEYKDLREVNLFPEVLCPTNEKVLPLIKKMLAQVLDAHPKTKYIHLGCNEVQFLGQCVKCKRLMMQNKWTPPDLYLNYVRKIALYLNSTYPGVRPIIWGDMVSKFRKTIISNSEISTLADVMIWSSIPNVSEYLTEKLLHIFANVFKSVWIASAFKGTTGVNQKITDVSYHINNHVSWMGIVNRWKRHINFKGIALTGQQRYNHFAELCELLPVGIPSLTASLIYLNGVDLTKNNKTTTILQCDHLLSFSPYSYYSLDLPECNFPGFMVYRLINKFEILFRKVQKYYNFPNEGHFSIRHVANRFGSPAVVKRVFEKRPVEEDLDELEFFEEELKTALLEIYDHYTVQEWLDTYVVPLRLKMEALSYAKDLIMEQETWPRRPLMKDKYNFEEAAKGICSSKNKVGCTLLLI